MFQRISLFFLLIAISSQFTSAQIIYPSDTLHAKPYPSGDQHILPQPFGGFNIGDVNGDGRDDYATTFRSNRPETSYLGDTKYVTAITFSEPKPTPDLIIDYYLESIGDMNNDGFTDFYAYQYDYDTQTNEYVIREMLAFNDQTNTLISSDTLSIAPQGGYSIVSKNSDIDKDGYNDVSFYRRDLDRLQVYFGGSRADDIETYLANIPFRAAQSSTSLGSLLIGDVDNDSKPEIIRIGMNNFDPFGDDKSDNLNTYIAVFEINEERELIRQDSSKVDIALCTEYLEHYCWGFGPQSIQADLIDTDGDNLQEIVIIGNYSGSLYKMIYASYDTLQQGYPTADWVLSDTTSDNPLPYVSSLVPINDFNGDGTPDFLAHSYYTHSDNINRIAHFDGQFLTFSESSFSGADDLYNKGDFNNDGFDDFSISYTDSLTGGYKLFFGNSSSSLNDTLRVVYAPYYQNQRRPIKYLLNVTDIDGDGIDDIGIVKNGIPWSKVPEQLEIYLSSTNELETLSPSITLQNNDFYSVSYPAVGDFNNDGYIDIAINHSDAEYYWYNSDAGVYIYFGDDTGISTSPDFHISGSDLYLDEDNQGFYYTKNIGDVNRDGFDDLAFSTGSNVRDLETNQHIGQTFVLFGGEELSDTPDLIIPIKGQDFERIEDLNGDGFNEFAISDALFNNHNQRSAGRVFIFNSFDENGNEQFDYTPLLEIPSPDSSAYYMGQFGINISSGDFNGDSFSDIVVEALYVSYNPGEDELIYIFEGSSTPDSLADEEITVTYEHIQSDIFRRPDYGYDIVRTNLGVVAGLPDINDDEKDELLIETGFSLYYSTNALLYPGDEIGSIQHQKPIVLYAPNQFESMALGRKLTGTYTIDYEPVFGNFTGSGNTDVLFYQYGEREFLTDPVIRYSLSGITVSNQREHEVATNFELSQNYPNPFNPSTTISYSLAGTSDVLMEVYNILGQKVATLVQEKQTAGSYRVTFNARNLSSGVYFYQLTTDQFTASKKMLLIK